jgi:hypothetical protein
VTTPGEARQRSECQVPGQLGRVGEAQWGFRVSFPTARQTMRILYFGCFNGAPGDHDHRRCWMQGCPSRRSRLRLAAWRLRTSRSLPNECSGPGCRRRSSG